MSRRAQPIVFEWKALDVLQEGGEIIQTWAMVPSARYANVAKRQFGDGGEHVLEESQERSKASHSQYFAALNDYFHNVPEKMAARWPTAEHFRKWLLVEAGWFDEKEFEMLSEKHAKGLATFIRTEDVYARIHVNGKKVIVRRAKSQSMKAMGKEDFEASKRAVLDLAEQLVGVPKGTVMKNAGRAA